MKAIALAAVLTLIAPSALAQGVPNLPPPPPPPGGGSSHREQLPPPPPPSQQQQQQQQQSATPRYTRAAPARTYEVEREDSVPPARTGFQMALRTGYMVPFGNASDGVKMADVVTGQFPLFVELGAKVVPNVFLGGYLELGFGGANGALKQRQCSGSQGCLAVSFRVGLEAQYHFQPGEKLNPWIGYGLGIESSAVGTSANGTDASTSFSGIEWAHFMGGLDVRVSRLVAIGPVADLALGTYSHTTTKVGGFETDASIAKTATHGWFMLGARVTFLP